ncbi:hypothetical protein J41TS2_39110 [Bacillus sonorensis]|nr:hypothetical protein J41TS2_39110 [Bacillus sonorensis]
MNYICDICKGYTAQPLCVRISEEKVRTAEDRIEINCCKKCSNELFSRVCNECKGMSIKKTLNHIGLNYPR